MNSEKIKLSLWSGVGGALVTMYVGFNFGGWVTNGGAVALAKEAAAVAVAERLGSICVAQFNRDKGKSEKLGQMNGKDSWEMGRYIDAQSWAIMPGEEKSESGVADACARQLSKVSETPSS
jgi:dienelactone hydrolase